MKIKAMLLASTFAPMLLVSPALAQGAPASSEDSRETSSEDDQSSASDIIVTGAIAFRNRTEDANPVLSYDLEYFQRFEPVSVGEMLKRVPGVTFTSDVLEYDGVQMRGLPAGYTQVLINGRRAPGGEADRSFFVDRIPAELVERIEIVRSPRADQPSEGVAGTLNVITKESTTFEGGFAKAGMLINQDGGVRPSGAIAYAGRLGDSTSIWAALNYQKRRNPKKKVSLRFDDVTTGPLDETNPVFKDTELQSDTRDGADLSGNAEITHEFAGGGRIRVSGFFVDTNRDEDETSLTYEGGDLEFDGVETQHEEIGQQTYALNADAVIPLGGLELGLAASWNGYRENTDVTVAEGGEEDLSDLEDVETEALDIKDDEYAGTISLTWGKDTPIRIKGGIDLLQKTRDGSDIVFDLEDDEEQDPDPAANFRIKEKRYDPYLRLTYEPSSVLSVDAGVRYEITRRRTTSLGGTTSYDSESLNPSLSLRYAVTPADQFRFSVARTVRRPSYDLISPYDQEESPADGDITQGNPALRNERAWGVDLGYERSLGSRGILGVNLFYRKIQDLTELVATGEDVIDDGDVIGSYYTPQNIGNGKVWGLEVDFSAPLTALGMPDTGIFANYTYLDSKTRDPFTGEKRRFNGQPHHVYNIGFIQTVKAVDASFGATISGRSKSLESNFDETVDLSYTPDLEAFVEKRIGKNFVMRASVQNLLNRKKKEVYRKYDGDNFVDILANRAAGDVDEYELERERSGRLFQVTLRAAF
jgi:outer membrane receptor for ferrienterochelin and colicins